MSIIYPGLNSLFKVSGTNCVNSYKYENKSWSETDIYKTRMPSPSRALPPVGGGVAGLPAAAADAVENVAAAVVEEAAGTADAASEEQEEHGSGSNIEPPHQLALAS